MKYRKVLAAVLCVCLVFAFAFGAGQLSENQPSQTDTVMPSSEPVIDNPASDGKTVQFYLALPREIVDNDLYTFYLTP